MTTLSQIETNHGRGRIVGLGASETLDPGHAAGFSRNDPNPATPPPIARKPGTRRGVKTGHEQRRVKGCSMCN